jgi:pimeloyl-ACP methyl ester carboxylesterase
MKIKTLLCKYSLYLLPLLSIGNCFSQGQFPITADIGYAAATTEVKKHFSVPGFTAGSPGDPYSNQVASGSYSVYPAFTNPSGQIIKPIIIVEGFDPTDIYSTDAVIELLNGGGGTFDDVADDLRTQGYDLIVLDYNDGGALIQRNAFLLVKLIQHINTVKKGTCPIVLAGYSMGGVVSRYALNYMEANSLPHNVGLFFSFDAPQKGANIPLSMQDMIDYLDNSPITYGLSADIRDQVRSIHSYAAQQMLIYHTDYIIGETVSVNPAFTTFYNQMKGLVGGNGYPSQPKLIAATLGNASGLGQRFLDANNVPQNHADVQTTLPFKAFDFIGQQNVPFVGYVIGGKAFTLPYRIVNPQGNLFLNMEISINSFIFTGFHQQGYFNAPIPADIMPGSFTPTFQLVADALNGVGATTYLKMNGGCFIPTLSALDFDSNNWFYDVWGDANRLSKTPFESIWYFANNADHRFPVSGHNALAAWILDEIAAYWETVPICEPALPVNLIEFDVKKENAVAQLSWKTATESNSEKFIVQRSADGKKWLNITEIQSNGDKSTPSTYSAIDNAPNVGMNYYRLKMVDRDRTFAYSSVQNLNFEGDEVIIYPNPVGSNEKINLLIERSKATEITIYDQSGKAVKALSGQSEQIDVTSLATGRYLIKIKLIDGTKTTKVLIKN